MYRTIMGLHLQCHVFTWHINNGRCNHNCANNTSAYSWNTGRVLNSDNKTCTLDLCHGDSSGCALGCRSPNGTCSSPVDAFWMATVSHVISICASLVLNRGYTHMCAALIGVCSGCTGCNLNGNSRSCAVNLCYVSNNGWNQTWSTAIGAFSCGAGYVLNSDAKHCDAGN